MKRLRKEFEYNGRIYNQLARFNNYVVFSLYDPVDAINTYEVVRIIKRSIENDKANTGRIREYYPVKKFIGDNVLQFESVWEAFDNFKVLALASVR
jgi:hypothetical protein